MNKSKKKVAFETLLDAVSFVLSSVGMKFKFNAIASSGLGLGHGFSDRISRKSVFQINSTFPIF